MTSQWANWDTYAVLGGFNAGDDEGPDRRIEPFVIDDAQRDVPMSGGGGGN